jgi:mannose-6-phosphate isomerase-like protein (cupin superfamily)
MLAVALVLMLALPVLVAAQQTGPGIDLRFGDWHYNAPRQTHGSLVERDILTQGDSMEPPRKGALLEADVNSLTYATLAPGASTTPTRLTRQQEIYYFLSGNGKMAAGGETAELYRNIAILMPADLEFVMTNTGSEPLTMYLINEPTPADFRPIHNMLVKDENALPIIPTAALRGPMGDGHWSHIAKMLFGKSDGLASIHLLLTVALDPLTIGEPHAHRAGMGSHETWTAIEGTSLALMGTELRVMTPGMAYMSRPDGEMEHANINYGKDQVKFLYLAASLKRQGASTEVKTPPPAYVLSNPPHDTSVDMFFGDWHHSTPRLTHGGIVVRDILTRGENFAPPQKGAVLEQANWFSYATLAPRASIPPAKLVDQQEVFYVLSGSGKMMAGGEIVDLHKGIATLMPAGLEFVMKNTGDEALSMYMINEPIPEGFKPNTKMLVRDESKLPFLPPAHWHHLVKVLFVPADGLGTMRAVLTVALDPRTMGEPHPHRIGHEEIWGAIDGTSLAFVGTQLRVQPPGTAYMLRPDGATTHSNINAGDSRVTFLYFSCITDDPRVAHY